jgi:hypothetical protein
MITRTQSLLAILLLWAATYLPALGFSEFHGEEAKRVVPAVSMIDSGQYLVPYLGGQPYLRKPPLVNWLVAASFQLFGIRNEWAARLPSTIFILAVAITLVTAGRMVLGRLIAIGIVGEIVIFPLRTMTFLKRHERVKPIAEQINAVALPGEPLYAIGQVSQPYFFYVRAPVIYVSTLDDLPATARNFFIQSRDLEKLEANPQWNVLRPQLVARIPRYRNREAMIFAVKPKKD